MLIATTIYHFSYGNFGLRSNVKIGSRTYSYTYNGSRLSRMTVDGHTLDFSYDASGRPLSVTYDGTPYFYVLSLQGDVMAILDSSGTAVVSYTYSAYGSSTYFSGSMRDTLGYYNPLRYRGYVYDPEYGLYYLQSRYYNSGLGRFNAPDAFASTGQGILGNNMFAYCRNNPVSRRDVAGTFDKEAYDSDGDPTSDEDDHRGMRASTGSGARGGSYGGPKLTYLGGKMCPNVGGRHGGMLHRTMVDGLKLLFKELGFDVLPSEKRVYYDNTNYRYPDVTIQKDGKDVAYVQVGKSTVTGDPIAREARAISDLKKARLPVFFFPYDD